MYLLVMVTMRGEKCRAGNRKLLLMVLTSEAKLGASFCLPLLVTTKTPNRRVIYVVEWRIYTPSRALTACWRDLFISRSKSDSHHRHLASLF